MNIGWISDDASVATAGQVLVLCGYMKHLGGGVSPSLGLLTAVMETMTEHQSLYVLVRPTADLFGGYSDTQKEVIAHEVKALSAYPRISGFLVAPLTTHGETIDIPFAAELVKAADGKELWLHRALMCVLDLDNTCAQLKSVGFTGVLAPLHGDVLAAKLAYAEKICEAAGKAQLRVMVLGPIVPEEFGGVCERLGGKSDILLLPLSPEIGAERDPIVPWRVWDTWQDLFSMGPTCPRSEQDVKRMMLTFSDLRVSSCS